MKPNTKQEEWAITLQQVEAMRDKQGLPVDAEIRETVATLRLWGFATIGSCGGHIDRDTGGPYVLIESKKAAVYAEKARKIASEGSAEIYRDLREKAMHYNALEIARLLGLLEDFYHNHTASYPHQLIVQSLPMAMCNLSFVGAEVLRIADKKQKRALLSNNQAEIYAFTEFLKQRYLQD